MAKTAEHVGRGREQQPVTRTSGRLAPPGIKEGGQQIQGNGDLLPERERGPQGGKPQVTTIGQG